MAPPDFFHISAQTDSTPELGHRYAWAKKKGKTLIVDGLVYGLDGESEVSSSRLPPARLAARLLDAYIKSGDDFFERLNGQCAIGIAEPGRATAFRHQLSGEQIYYSKQGFSNHLLPVYLDEKKPPLDPDYFFDFLSDSPSLQYESIRTPFLSVHRLKPGACVRFENGSVNLRQIIPKRKFPYSQYPGQRLEEAAHNLRAKMNSAIDSRLPSDPVSVTCHLSGGLDSSFVAALLAAQVPKVSAFMYSFPGRPSHAFSEQCALLVAKHLGIEFTIVPPEEIPKVELRMNQPYRDEPSAAFWQAALFAPVTDRFVPDGGVLFTGLGADQILLRDSRIMAWLLKEGKFAPVLSMLDDAARDLNRSRLHLLWQTCLMTVPRPWYRKLNDSFSGWRFNPFAMEEMDLDNASYARVPWLDFERRKKPLLNREGSPQSLPPSSGVSKLEFSYLAVPQMMSDPYLNPRGARSAHPYFDSRVIEYTLRDVSWDLVHDWKSPYKNLLREAQRGILPEKVRNREKNEFYFDGFLGALLRDNRNMLYDLLSAPDLPIDVSLSKKNLLTSLEELIMGVTSNSTMKLLVLIAYLTWWRDFQKESLPLPSKPH